MAIILKVRKTAKKLLSLQEINHCALNAGHSALINGATHAVNSLLIQRGKTNTGASELAVVAADRAWLWPALLRKKLLHSHCETSLATLT